VKQPSARTRRPARKGDRPSQTSRVLVGRRAAIFRNGRNQAVRLPQDLRFPDKVKAVQVRKQGDSILLSPVKPDWASFFALEVTVPDDVLARDDSPPQQRKPL
jgi:antitoxin VapB